MLRRAPAKQIANRIIDFGIGHMVFAEHFKINAERGPAHTEIRLPLQLHRAAGDGQGRVAPVFIFKGDGAVFSINLFHRHIKHAA